MLDHINTLLPMLAPLHSYVALNRPTGEREKRRWMQAVDAQAAVPENQVSASKNFSFPVDFLRNLLTIDQHPSALAQQNDERLAGQVAHPLNSAGLDFPQDQFI